MAMSQPIEEVIVTVGEGIPPGPQFVSMNMGEDPCGTGTFINGGLTPSWIVMVPSVAGSAMTLILEGFFHSGAYWRTKRCRCGRCRYHL